MLQGVAILTKEKGAEGIPYLDKFTVSAKVRGQGIKELLWGRIIRENPKMFWRSRSNNSKINPWYFTHADGHVRTNDWIVFWYGNGSAASASEALVKTALAIPSTLEAAPKGESQAAKKNVVTPPAKGYRIGLLGGRGHTGSHLIHLLSQHSHVCIMTFCPILRSVVLIA